VRCDFEFCLFFDPLVRVPRMLLFLISQLELFPSDLAIHVSQASPIFLLLKLHVWANRGSALRRNSRHVENELG